MALNDSNSTANFSKIILNGTTLMDVTQDSVVANTLLQGETATRADGERIMGTLTASSGINIGEYEEIARYTVPQNSESVTVNTDINGESFALSNAYIILKFGTPTTSTQDYVKGYFTDENGLSRSIPTLKLISSNSTTTWFEYIFESGFGVPHLIAKASSSGNTQAAQLVTFTGTSNNQTIGVDVKALVSITFQQYNSSSTLIPQGSEIIIYGIRYNENSGSGSSSSTVQNVQINGTSIVNNSIANIPIAASNVLGVIKPGDMGVNVNSSGELSVGKASSNQIKAGTTQFNPIVPYNQHESVFYALAKAASDTTQSSSSNAIGTYTNEAKIAIQKMLGIYEAPWEAIKSDSVTNATEADIEITTDSDGQPLSLTDIVVAIIVGDSNVDSSYNDYGRVRYYYSTNNYYDTITGSNISVTAGGTKRGFYSLMEQNNGLLKKISSSQTTVSNNANLVNYITNNITGQLFPYVITDSPVVFNKIVFRKITGTISYVIYGKRTWE